MNSRMRICSPPHRPLCYPDFWPKDILVTYKTLVASNRVSRTFQAESGKICGRLLKTEPTANADLQIGGACPKDS